MHRILLFYAHFNRKALYIQPFHSTVTHILQTYHVDILDLLTLTNYIRQNLTANFSASHSCTLELPFGILSPYMLKMQLRLTLLNVSI